MIPSIAQQIMSAARCASQGRLDALTRHSRSREKTGRMVLEWLTDRRGERFTVAQIADAVHLSRSQTSMFLVALFRAEKVRRASKTLRYQDAPGSCKYLEYWVD